MKFLAILSAVLFTTVIPMPAHSATSSSLKLTTYNIHSGIPDGSSIVAKHPTTLNLHNIADVLTTASSDIVAMQEVRNLWSKPVTGKVNEIPLNISHYLATLMGMNYAFGSTLDSTSGYPENRNYMEWGNNAQWTNNAAPHGEFGNAVLSRLPMLPPSIIKLPRGDAEAIKNSDEARNAVRVQLQDQMPGLGTVIIYSTHLQHNNGKTREAQVRELLRVAQADATSATVFIMGDMNHHPHAGEPDLLALFKNAGFHDLAADFARQSGTEPHHTIGHNNTKRRIDYIFCSRQVDITDVQVLETPVSDHLPLTVTINLK